MRKIFLVSLTLAYILEYALAVAIGNVAKIEDPLFLTTLIENGQIEEARKKALVQHEEMKDVESYSGFLTINKQYNSNTFFWYFPSENNPKEAPLLLWLNGGPGTTSLLGLFAENGPFIITKNQTLEFREYSWSRNHNIIYMDNPVGTGYSFTEDDLGYPRNSSAIGRDVLIALIQFFKLFPELRKNDFYVTGESYAGKYVPAVSYAIKMYNLEAETIINLKGLAYGNGITDPIDQINHSDFWYQIGLLDDNERQQLKEMEEGIESLYRQEEYIKAALLNDKIRTTFYTSETSFLKNATGFDYYYNFLQSKEPASIWYFVQWIQRADVRNSLHVGNSTFVTSSQKVKEHLLPDLIKSVAPWLADLLEGYKTLIYSGQLDIAVPYTTTENFVKKLVWTGAEKYITAARKQWWLGEELAGYSKTVGNLNVVLVRNAGHFVPTDQPLWSYDLITRFTHGKKF